MARAVSSSLGIAVLATLVQTQTQVHYDHLAEQVTPSSLLGRLLPQLQALFVSEGGNLVAAQTAALQTISGLVQEQAFILAIQDAFRFSLVVTFLAIIAVLFVSKSRRQAPPTPGTWQGTQRPGQPEEEAAHPTFAFTE